MEDVSFQGLFSQIERSIYLRYKRREEGEFMNGGIFI